eukprot:918589-Pleurochrysis_carterae.AAC.3
MPSARFSFLGALGTHTSTRGRHVPSSSCFFAKTWFARSIARVGQKFSSRASREFFGVKTSFLSCFRNSDLAKKCSCETAESKRSFSRASTESPRRTLSMICGTSSSGLKLSKRNSVLAATRWRCSLARGEASAEAEYARSSARFAPARAETALDD